MPTRTLVVVNPKSRSGAGGRRFARVESLLREAMGPVEVEWTRGPRDAERIAREAVRAGVERIIVAAGDGTTSEVVTGILGAELGRYCEIGLLPLGTGGDLARSVGVPESMKAAVAALAAGKTRRIDAGRATFLARDGREASTCFVNVASAGMSGLVTELVNLAPKHLGGTASFLIGTLRALRSYRFPPVRARVDDLEVHAGPLVLAAAANGRFFGGGMAVAPGAELDDGLLDIVLVPGFSRTTLLRQLPRIYRGTHLEVPGVSLHRGRGIALERMSEEQVWIELDGEPLGTLPARFEVIPGAITLFGLPE